MTVKNCNAKDETSPISVELGEWPRTAVDCDVLCEALNRLLSSDVQITDRAACLGEAESPIVAE